MVSRIEETAPVRIEALLCNGNNEGTRGLKRGIKFALPFLPKEWPACYGSSLNLHRHLSISDDQTTAISPFPANAAGDRADIA
jgi:hypothetical protein